MIGTDKRYHFVGIGGAGMSGLASVFLEQGLSVSGSDLKENPEIEYLRRAGAAIHLGHDPSHVRPPLDGVIVSSAVSLDNVEIRAARRMEIPVIFRLHALNWVMERYKSIGVAGTHGKTTTATMIATILKGTGRDPGFLIGAPSSVLGGRARLGGGEWFVAEVDESDGLFVGMSPTIAVVTNVGKDHLTTYGSLSSIESAFQRYISQADRVVLDVDRENMRRWAASHEDALTVGIDSPAELRAEGILYDRFTTSFDLIHAGSFVARVFLPAPGEHNVRNALCALGAASLAGVDLREAARSLARFTLPHRRFQLMEENGVTVVDDYAHLPEEVAATLRAIRTGWPGRRIIAIFQPHRYTRTRDLGEEFGSAFSDADLALVTGIYPAGERPIPGVSSDLIVRAIAERAGVDVRSIPDKQSVFSFLMDRIRAGDFIISFGAGDIWTVTEGMSAFLKEGRFRIAA